MNKDPLETIKNADPQFLEIISRNRDHAFKEGALPAKIKFLIALALDAAHGASAGVTSLAQQALKNGATREEIMEAIHVTHFISGVGSVYTASIGLKDVF